MYPLIKSAFIASAILGGVVAGWSYGAVVGARHLIAMEYEQRRRIQAQTQG